jgi:phage terminase small subunit
MANYQLTDEQRQIAAGLNPKQIAFAVGIAAGLNQRQAYQEAGYSATGARADASASRLLRNAKVSDLIKSMKQAAIERGIITRAESLAALSDIVRSDKAKPLDKINAVKVLAQMEGWNAPEKVEIGEKAPKGLDHFYADLRSDKWPNA